MTGTEMWRYDDFYEAFWDVYDTIHLARLLDEFKRAEDDIADRRTYRLYMEEVEGKLGRFWSMCHRCRDGDHGQCLNDLYRNDHCACDHHGGINEVCVREVP